MATTHHKTNWRRPRGLSEVGDASGNPFLIQQMLYSFSARENDQQTRDEQCGAKVKALRKLLAKNKMAGNKKAAALALIIKYSLAALPAALVAAREIRT